MCYRQAYKQVTKKQRYIDITIKSTITMPGITSQACPPSPDNINIDGLSDEELDACLSEIEATKGPFRKNKRFPSLPAHDMPNLASQVASLDLEQKVEVPPEAVEIPEDLLSEGDDVSRLDGEELENLQGSNDPCATVVTDEELDVFDSMSDEALDEHLSHQGPLMTKRDDFLRGPTKAELSALGPGEAWDSDTNRIVKALLPRTRSTSLTTSSLPQPARSPVADHIVALFVTETWRGTTCTAYEAALARAFLTRFAQLSSPALVVAHNLLRAYNAAQIPPEPTAPELLLIAAIALAMAYTEDEPWENEVYSGLCEHRWSADQIDRATIDLFRRLGWTLVPYATPDARAAGSDRLFPPEVPGISDILGSGVAGCTDDRALVLRTACKEHWMQVLDAQAFGNVATSVGQTV